MKHIQGYSTDDTIAAIATFPSPSALGLIKISGKKAIAIVSRIFRSSKKTSIKKAKSFTLHYGWIAEAGQKRKSTEVRSARIIDEVLVSVMRKPRSYTREDVVEISSHGGLLVLDKILKCILREGARLAKPGEFSYRAFINGRLDLLQAQAIADIVEAKTEKALFSSGRQLAGDFSRRIKAIQAELKEILTLCEASVSFPEDRSAITNASVTKRLRAIREAIREFLTNTDTARILREGIRCVICGKANAGKSTLFNCLLKEERVLVTHIAGTTRDVIEETINIRGIPLRIYDTAGILEAKDFIDAKAIEKSYKKLKAADIVLFVFDASRTFSRHDRLLLDTVVDKNVIFIVNKIDCKKKLDTNVLKTYKKPIVDMCARKGTGLRELEKALYANTYRHGFKRKENLILLSQWQSGLLRSIDAHIEETLRYSKGGYPLDYIVFALQPALDDLGRLTGERASEEILNAIFTRFCIGK